jgi:hypothetical protein
MTTAFAVAIIGATVVLVWVVWLLDRIDVASSDDGDGPDEGGGGGGNRPREPKPPAGGGSPGWWAEFEADFADHVESRSAGRAG